MSATIDLDLSSPDFRRDPYPYYRRLREADPIHWNPPGTWLVTRYADAAAILRDPHIGHPAGRAPETIEELRKNGKLTPLEFLLSSWMVTKNPPDHTRLRGLINRAFTPQTIEQLRPRIYQIVHQLLDEAAKKGTFDLMADFAYPLPVMVVAEMLGVPLEDRTQFREWSRDLLGIVDLVRNEEAMKRGSLALQKFIDYFRALVTLRRAAPQNDLLSGMILAQDQDDALSEDELMANCIFLFVAGHETTMHLIGNGVLALLNQPDQWALLRENPALMVGAVEELLRYAGSVQFYGRFVREDVEINGQQLRKGQGLFILPGAINRDPEQFTNPERLDITRVDNRHMAFGLGIHFCLGAPLARLEGKIAIESLIQRMPNLKLQPDSLVWQNTVAVRGLKQMFVTA